VETTTGPDTQIVPLLKLVPPPNTFFFMLNKEVIMENENITIYEARCPFCRKISTVPVKIDELFKYEVLGELAQKAFRSLNPTQREQIISGLCPDCQKQVFDIEEEGF
jgi:endogenous inhibitor of DNA gyrase (YacG/DUF329 family)